MLSVLKQDTERKRQAGGVGRMERCALLGEQTDGFSQIQTFGTPESRCILKKRDRARQQQHQGPELFLEQVLDTKNPTL